MTLETAFTMDTSSIKYGSGVTREVGWGMRAKTALRQRAARPSLGIVDAFNTRTMPPMVAECSGLDVFCHSLESLTAPPSSAPPV